MSNFDQAQSPRLGQRTPVESTSVRMFTGATIPEAAWPGQVIYRTDTQVLQVFTEAGAWEDVVSGVPGLLTFVGPDIPISQSAGDLWFDSANGNAMYRAEMAGANEISSTEWLLVQDYNAALTAAAGAQATADAKSVVFRQADAPVSSGDFTLTAGDMWINTDMDNQVSTWDGSAWVPSILGTQALDQYSLTLQGLTILNNLELRGVENFLSGTLTLAGGVSDPPLAPTVSGSYQQLGFTGGTNLSRRGLGYSAGGWYWADANGTSTTKIQRADDTTGAVTQVRDLDYGASNACLTTTGGFHYVVQGYPGVYQVIKTTIIGVEVDAYENDTDSFNYTSWPAIGNDGTNIYVAFVTTTGNLYVRTFDDDLNEVSIELLVSGWGTNRPIGSITKQSLGLGGTRWIVAALDQIYVYNTTGPTRLASEEWPHASGWIRGLGVYNGSWWSHNGATLTKYEHGLSGTWDFAYTWYDADPLPGVSDYAESKISPIRTIAPTKWSKWKVTIPVAPADNGDPDDPNTARIYAAPTTTTLERQTTLAEGTLSHTYTSLTPSGSNPPPGISGFAARAPIALGEIVSRAQNLLAQPVVELTGEGPGRVGHIAWDENGEDANDTGWITLPNIFTSSFGIRYRVKSGIICVQVDGNVTLPNTTTTTISSSALPAAYRPVGMPFVREGAYMNALQGFVFVSEAGVVQAYHSTGTSRSNCNATLSYPIP